MYAWFDQNVGGAQKLSSAELATNQALVTPLVEEASGYMHPIKINMIVFVRFFQTVAFLFTLSLTLSTPLRLTPPPPPQSPPILIYPPITSPITPPSPFTTNQADEDRWGLYYGVKAMAKDDAEAQVFWGLLDEAHGEDGQQFLFHCLR